jgi:hypothetical protein
MRSHVLPGGLLDGSKKEHIRGGVRNIVHNQNGGGEQGAGVFRGAGDHAKEEHRSEEK